MSHLLENVIEEAKEARESVMEEISHSKYARLERALLTVRNIFVLLAVTLFVTEFFVTFETRNILKSVAYFSGAVAYIMEFLIETDFFTKKVPHSEMFMLYCFGPLYILLGIGYIL